MQLQIKTIDRKTLLIDAKETQTIYELKKELALLPEVGVAPNAQVLIYAGKILCNCKTLGMFNIDVKKPLVLLRLRWGLKNVQIFGPKIRAVDYLEPPTPTTKEEERELKRKAHRIFAHLAITIFKRMGFSTSALRTACSPINKAVGIYFQREPFFKSCNQSVRKKPEYLLNFVIGRMLPIIFQYLEYGPRGFICTASFDDDKKDDDNKSDKNE